MIDLFLLQILENNTKYSAQDVARSEDKSSITPEHVYKALEELEFNFADEIKQFLPQYKAHKETKQQTKKPKQASTSDAKQSDQQQEDEEDEPEEEEQQDEMQIDEKDSKE